MPQVYWSTGSLVDRYMSTGSLVERSDSCRPWNLGPAWVTISNIWLNFQVHERNEKQLQQQNSITEAIRVQPSLAQARLPREAKRRFQIFIPLIHVLLDTPLQLGCLLPLQQPLWQYWELAHIPLRKM